MVLRSDVSLRWLVCQSETGSKDNCLNDDHLILRLIFSISIRFCVLLGTD